MSAGRQVVPELRALPEDRTDAIAEPPALSPGHQAADPHVSRRGMQNPRQHLDRRRLAGTVRAHERDALAGLHAEADAVDRHDVASLRKDELAQCAPQPRRALANPKDLAQLL